MPSVTHFGFVGEEIVGRLMFRRRLNERLLTIGGHIGYVVLPPFRGRGYAKSMLRQGLELARRDGIARVLLTCDEDNVASARTIASVGAVFEDFFEVGNGAPRKARYWVVV